MSAMPLLGIVMPVLHAPDPPFGKIGAPNVGGDVGAGVAVGIGMVIGTPDGVGDGVGLPGVDVAPGDPLGPIDGHGVTLPGPEPDAGNELPLELAAPPPHATNSAAVAASATENLPR